MNIPSVSTAEIHRESESGERRRRLLSDQGQYVRRQDHPARIGITSSDGQPNSVYPVCGECHRPNNRRRRARGCKFIDAGTFDTGVPGLYSSTEIAAKLGMPLLSVSTNQRIHTRLIQGGFGDRYSPDVLNDRGVLVARHFIQLNIDLPTGIVIRYVRCIWSVEHIPTPSSPIGHVIVVRLISGHVVKTPELRSSTSPLSTARRAHPVSRDHWPANNGRLYRFRRPPLLSREAIAL